MRSATAVAQAEAGHGRGKASETFSRQSCTGAKGVDMDSADTGLELKAAEVKISIIGVVELDKFVTRIIAAAGRIWQ